MATEKDSEYESESESEYESESDYGEDIHSFKYADHELKPVKSMKEFHRRFALGCVLGSGGDGDVYTDQTKAWPAIKKIDLDNFEDQNYEIKRAQQEQRLLAKAKLANIYAIYHDEKENVLYKIYDRYDYVLDDIIDNLEVGMTEAQTKHCIYNICCDIKKLHSQQFIHCDIKPSNILYTKRGTFKMKNRDTQTFKLIDYDGAIWNQTNDVVCTAWQGSLPFSAPEMNDYLGDINTVGYAVDVWSIGLLIVYCMNGGHLGLMDMDDDAHMRFYHEYSEEQEEEAWEIKSAIFDEWYQDLFGEEMGYQREIAMLYKTGKISRDLYDLLYDGILVKNPEERMTIEELLNDKWFQETHDAHDITNIRIVDEEHKEQRVREMDLYDGIMSQDLKIRNQIILAQIELIHEEQEKADETDSEDEEEESGESEEEDQDENEGKLREDTPEIRYYSDDEAISIQSHLPHLHSQYGATSLSCYSNVSTGCGSPRGAYHSYYSGTSRKGSNSSD